MSNRVVITEETINHREYLVTALFEGSRMAEVSCDAALEPSLIGNIYIGKIKRILPELGAAFVEIAPGKMTYLPLSEAGDALMVKQQRAGVFTQEDEIVVQIAKDAVKTKEPSVTTNLSIKGNALIFTAENKKLGISKKIESGKRKYFQSIFAEKMDGRFGLIVRTNAENCTKEQLTEEFDRLLYQFLLILQQYRYRTCYSLLYQAPSEYISRVRDYLGLRPEKIVTDDFGIYEELQQTFQEEPVEFYEDAMLSLSALYGLKFKLKEALKERVWLDSGAYLIIWPTEALTVIDVNSGKCFKGKRKDFYLKVNVEAAIEIARQMRLRNISGICIVDFINMDTKEAEEELIHVFKRELAKDTVPAVFVDFTMLGLAELTRKKVKKPLWEQITQE